MFLLWHRGDFFPLCLCGIVGVVLFGLWPRSAVASLFLVRRNANLAGGFAGRPVFVFSLVWFSYLPQPRFCVQFGH
jgi:hypothetical protein